VLLVVGGALEMLETFQAPDEVNRFSAYLGGALSVLAGVLLQAHHQFVLGGLGLLLAVTFLIDGIGKVMGAWKARAEGDYWGWKFCAGLANLVLALVLGCGWPVSGIGVVVAIVGVRMLAAGWLMLLRHKKRLAPPAEPPPAGLHPDRRLRLAPHQAIATLKAAVEAREGGRTPVDTYWFWAFIITFFAIHTGRMQAEWNFVGLFSPVVATFGDVVTALLLAYGLVLPARLAWRKLTRPLERRAWRHVLTRLDQGQKLGLFTRLMQSWLASRLRFTWRMLQARHSLRASLHWGLRVGLPVIAVLIALNPIWGFSWYYNSENWASGIWDRWAARRTDTWREQMIEAVRDHFSERGVPEENLFRVQPEGVTDQEDFSFLVLGDTGEGDASQLCLRDQFLALGRRPDVKFLVVSSDVIYPSGAMSDYEPKFYLPFKGFTKPIYAIPGNHDWYDALEGFAANFLEADAARVCMRARVLTDNRITSTTEARIERLIREAARLRGEFGVSTGWQRGPFFEVQTERFALLAVDTGVLRQIDTRQWDWLNGALDRSRGKFTFAILGHPLYAGGHYQGGTEGAAAGEWGSREHPFRILGRKWSTEIEPFAAIHRLLREHQVEVVMAGDTHSLEYYRETYPVEGSTRTMHHFVNGGGGAYLSIGTPLDWPGTPAVPDCAFYPRTDALTAKLDRETPAWKWPLWMWVKHARGWPTTVESMASAFDYDHAPYLQSFVEIRVEGSANRIRLLPYGASGQLRWRDFQTFGAVLPAGKTGADLVEFVVPMPARRR
jgi:hypothetical protein